MNYSKYKMTFWEALIIIFTYTAISYLISKLFYDNYKYTFLFLLGFPAFYRYIKRQLIKKNKEELKTQFCEMISIVSTSLSAGLSMENSLNECLGAMINLFGENAFIVTEVKSFLQKLSINKSIDSIMIDFAERSGLQEIKDFSIVLTETMKCGGSVPNVISRTVTMMKQKSEIECEIKAMLNGKVLEQRIMSIVPFFIIVYLRASSGSFMDSLYHNTKGVALMTACLLIYALSVMLAAKITTIEV